MIGAPIASSSLASNLVKVALDGVSEAVAITSAATVAYDRIGAIRLVAAITSDATVYGANPWRFADANAEIWTDAAANDETWTPAAANAETWADA